MRTQRQQKSELEREADRLTADGYIVINHDQNAMTTILTDLGKADLSPREVETLCQTAKCMTLNGFVRIDLLPCGCGRMYRGLTLGYERHPTAITLRVGGIEGVKPCPKHTELIDSIKLEEKL